MINRAEDAMKTYKIITLVCSTFSLAILFILHSYTNTVIAREITQIDATLMAGNNYYNDVALFISGQAIKESSSLYQLTTMKCWKKYASASEKIWFLFKKNKMNKISAWEQSEIRHTVNPCNKIFYPFSGPDFLYAYTIFPDADKYVLVGLEPVGTLPDLKNMDNITLSAFLSSLSTSIDDVLKMSFFKTNDMSEMLCSKQPITGTLPVLLLFIVRTGHEIVDIKPVEIVKNGDITYLNAFKIFKGPARFGKGAEIIFKSTDGTNIKKLYYYCADISNDGLSKKKEVKLFFGNGEFPCTTFIKSASYLLHKNYFSCIRKIILDTSINVLQDDSAIPYKYFNKTEWDLQCFGSYTGPIDLFNEHFEDDLKTAFDNNSKKLNFRFGYARKSNLLLAKKHLR